MKSPRWKRQLRSGLKSLGLRWTPAWSRTERLKPGHRPLDVSRAGAQFGFRDVPRQSLTCDARGRGHQPNSVLRQYDLDQSGDITYRFNSAGFRGEDLRPEAAFRICLIGESHALGVGVDEDRMPAQRIKAHLAAAWDMPLDDVNAVTFAVGAASADFCARQALMQIDRVQPDLLLCIMPSEDRFEDYHESHGRSYGISAIDLEKIEDAPLPVQGFVDLWNPIAGKMNTLRNALTIQMLCQQYGVEHILMSQTLWPKTCTAPILKPINARLDRDRILLHRYYVARPDFAADERHGGVRTQEAVALTALIRYSDLLLATGDADRGQKLATYLEQEMARNEDWRFVLDAIRS